MAYFAEIDKNNTVLRIVVVDDVQQHRGQDFLAIDLGLGGKWIQCSYTSRIRKQYPGIGFHYDAISDVFIAPKPYESWILDSNHDWQPPVPKPQDNKHYVWNEDFKNWE